MKITDRIKQLGFPAGQYVVVGSGVLEAVGLRKANDIDIAVLPELYNQLRSTGEWDEKEVFNKIFLMKDDVEIIPQLDWEDYSTTTQMAIDSAMTVDDVPFMNLQELKRFKQAQGREKDKADLILLEGYLDK